MSIDFSRPKQPETAEEIALTLKLQAKNVYNNMLNTYCRGLKMFWDNSYVTPEQIASALGNDAKELFELHYKLGQLLSTIDTAAIVQASSVIGQFIMNDDGTVSVVSQTTSPSEPTA